MLAFVTGATGFLGSHVARALMENGADLRLLVRTSSNTKNIDDLKADRVLGDLREPGSLAKGIAGCDVIFHVAADYRLWVPNPEEMGEILGLSPDRVKAVRAKPGPAKTSGVSAKLFRKPASRARSRRDSAKT